MGRLREHRTLHCSRIQRSSRRAGQGRICPFRKLGIEAIPGASSDMGAERLLCSCVRQDILPVELHIPNRDSSLRASVHDGRFAATEGKHKSLLFTAGN